MIYGLLFQAAAETLLTIAADPRNLGARIGLTAVLHTWDSALTHHPQVHCSVPGGGISLDGERWVACRRGFAGASADTGADTVKGQDSTLAIAFETIVHSNVGDGAWQVPYQSLQEALSIKGSAWSSHTTLFLIADSALGLRTRWVNL